MNKVKFTADTLMTIVKSIFEDEDVNLPLSQGIKEWEGKTINDILKIHYYTFKHKVMTLEEKYNIIKSEDTYSEVGYLDFFNQSYCLVSIDNMQRLFSKDIDQISIEGTLEFWLQTEKVKFLEELIEGANLATCGVAIPVDLNGQTRKCIIYFDSLNVSSIDIDGLGETSIVNLGVSILLYPHITFYNDYKIEFKVDGEYIEFPVIRINCNNSMIPKSIPKMNNPSCADNLNLSNVTSFTMDFNPTSDNLVGEMFVEDSLSRATINILNKGDINKVYNMRLTRRNKVYLYDLKIQDHKIQMNNSIEPETNTIVFAIGGNNGTT